MKYITLNNGIQMPILGYGVYQIPKEETTQAVLNAIKIGYRLIDTAQSYFNEKEVGDAIRESGVDRKEFFITSKIWIDNYGYDKCKESVYESLKNLQTDYIDLMLVHQPFGDYYGTYKALEDLYKEGKIRSIGVSNFYPDRLADICLFGRKIIPAINQIEVNPFNQRTLDIENALKFGVQIEAWAPFGEGRNNMFGNTILAKIGKKYNKSVAQVVLRWNIQRNIVVVCKSTQADKMAENFDVFDFELSDSDMQTIQTLDTKQSLFFNHQDPKIVEWFDNIVDSRRHNHNINTEKKGW